MDRIHRKQMSITLQHVERDLSTWGPKLNSDTVTERIVKATKNSPMAVMALCFQIGRELSDEEIEAHLRRGWSYLKAIFGAEQAIAMAEKAGTIIAIATASMLEFFSNFENPQERIEHMQQLLFIPAVAVNIVEILAEYNGTSGEAIGEQLLGILPMTNAERAQFIRLCSTIDYSQKTVH